MARITVWLFIEATDLSVEEMAARIGLAPDTSWRIGDQRGRTGKAYETNSWCLESVLDGIVENPLSVGMEFESKLNAVLRRVGDHAEGFRSVASGRSAGVYVGVTAAKAPALELSATTISALSRVGVDMEIDLMLGE